MSTERLKWWLILFPAMAGCIYDNVREVEPDQSFHGLKHGLQRNDVTLNVVFVHGMGDHPFGEQGLLDYQVRIAAALGFDEGAGRVGVDWGPHCQAGYAGYGYFSGAETKRLETRLKKGQAVCPLKIHDVVVGFLGWRQYRAPDGGNTLNLFELSWDRATELLQKTLLELDDDYYETVELGDDLAPMEGGRNREADRVVINRLLKRFVNQNLGDPAIYLGAYGDPRSPPRPGRVGRTITLSCPTAWGAGSCSTRWDARWMGPAPMRIAGVISCAPSAG